MRAESGINDTICTDAKDKSDTQIQKQFRIRSYRTKRSAKGIQPSSKTTERFPILRGQYNLKREQISTQYASVRVAQARRRGCENQGFSGHHAKSRMYSAVSKALSSLATAQSQPSGHCFRHRACKGTLQMQCELRQVSHILSCRQSSQRSPSVRNQRLRKTLQSASRTSKPSFPICRSRS